MDTVDPLFLAALLLLLTPTDIPIMATRATSRATSTAERFRFTYRVGDDDDASLCCVTLAKGSSAVTWPLVSISIGVLLLRSSGSEALMIDVGGFRVIVVVVIIVSC